MKLYPGANNNVNLTSSLLLALKVLAFLPERECCNSAGSIEKVYIIFLIDIVYFLSISEVEAPSKKVKGVGLGNIFANGPIVLKKAGSNNEPTKMVRSRQSVVESPAAAKVRMKMFAIT